MKCIKVSIWCLISLLFLNVVAMGEENITMSATSDKGEYFWDDPAIITVTIENIGDTIVNNLRIYYDEDYFMGYELLCGEASGPFDMVDILLGETITLTHVFGLCDYTAGEPGPWVAYLNYFAGYEDVTEMGDNAIASANTRISVIERPNNIPEFPTVALPAIAIMGLIFLLQRRKAD